MELVNSEKVKKFGLITSIKLKALVDVCASAYIEIHMYTLTVCMYVCVVNRCIFMPYIKVKATTKNL